MTSAACAGDMYTPNVNNAVQTAQVIFFIISSSLSFHIFKTYNYRFIISKITIIANRKSLPSRYLDAVNNQIVSQTFYKFCRSCNLLQKRKLENHNINYLQFEIYHSLSK